MAGHLDLKVGWDCNNDCIHCVVADKRQITEKQNFTIEDIEQILLNNKEVNDITITGGEPTIREDFIDICKLIKKIIPNSVIDLQTNGRGLKDNNICKEVVKYINYFVVAIHHFDKNIHDKITRSSGSWDDTMQAVANLLNLDPWKVNPLLVISKINMKDISKIVDFYYAIGSKRSTVTFPHGMGNAWKNRDMVIPKYSEIENHIDYIIQKYPNTITSAFPPCYLTKNVYNMVYSLGEYKPEINRQTSVCVELCHINEDKKNFYELVKTDLKKGPNCKKCIFNKDCLGVWDDYIKMYSNELDLKPIIKEK